MNLLLTSYRIPDPSILSDLLGRDPSAAKLALIINAKDSFIDHVRQVIFEDKVEFFTELGFKNIVEIDLRTLTSDQLVAKLNTVDVVWVSGGNTFCLNEAAMSAGFKQAMLAVKDSELLYIGESAGSVLAGTTLETVELSDNPRYARSIYWDGLGLVDQAVVPHADSDFFIAGTQAARERFSEKEVIFIDDNQMLTVVNGQQTLSTH